MTFIFHCFSLLDHSILLFKVFFNTQLGHVWVSLPLGAFIFYFFYFTVGYGKVGYGKSKGWIKSGFNILKIINLLRTKVKLTK